MSDIDLCQAILKLADIDSRVQTDESKINPMPFWIIPTGPDRSNYEWAIFLNGDGSVGGMSLNPKQERLGREHYISLQAAN